MSITTLKRHEVPLNYFNWMNHFNNVSQVSNLNKRSPEDTRIKVHVSAPNLFPDLVNEYVSICLMSTYVTAEYNTVLGQNKLVY